MGSAIGACLADTGHHVVWASAGRSAATAQRAIDAGLVDAGTVEQVVAECHVVFSVCPPHAAAEVVRAIHDFRGTFVEANAISPRTARQIAAAVNGQGASVVDGGIIGPPPGSTTPGGTRFYLAGPEAATVAGLFDSTPVDARIVEGELGAASALKMTYAAWTKGSRCTPTRHPGRGSGNGRRAGAADRVGEVPTRADRPKPAGRKVRGNEGWRWIAEMEEIASTFADAGLPGGFHRAAAEVYRRAAYLDADDRP
jgi:hypothetical protein